MQSQNNFMTMVMCIKQKQTWKTSISNILSNGPLCKPVTPTTINAAFFPTRDLP